MNTTPIHQTALKILIGFDGSDGARAAVEDLRHAGLPPEVDALVLTCADVPVNPPFYSIMPVEGGGIITQSAIDAAREAADREMQKAASVAVAGADLVSGQFPGWKVRADSAPGASYWYIVERAKQSAADLVVVGSHGRSALGRLFFGSVSQNVLSHAPCPVRVGRRRSTASQREPDAPLRLLLAVDGSPDAAAAVDLVSRRTWPAGTEVRVATALDLRLSLDLTSLIAPEGDRHTVSPVQRLVHSVGDRLRDSRLTVSTVILEGGPTYALMQEAERWGADCIFLGARGHSRLERFLIGSVSASVAARAGCSVEVVRRPL